MEWVIGGGIIFMVWWFANYRNNVVYKVHKEALSVVYTQSDWYESSKTISIGDWDKQILQFHKTTLKDFYPHIYALKDTND